MITSKSDLLPDYIYISLQSKMEEHEKNASRYSQALIPTFATSVLLTGINLFSCNPFFGVGALTTLSFGATCASFASKARDTQKKTKILLNKYDQIVNFYDAFQDFELSPEDQKVKNVFAQFLKLSEGAECSLFSDHQLIENGDLQLFQSTGKVFLMDAVAKILQEKDKNSIFAEQWDDLLESTVNETYDIKEPWKTVGMYEPDVQAYRHFFLIRHQVTSTPFVDNLVTIFKHAIEKAIQTHVI